MTGPIWKQSSPGPQSSGGGAFPLPALIALALSGFITILTEALPAGLLAQIGEDFSISQAAAGQMVTIYAIGSLMAAIPLTRATQGLRRRPLLTSAIAGFAVANLITALSPSYALTMAARFVAGVSAGLLWALLAGYAARMAPEAQKGRAIAVAMAGTPLALSVGIPAATFLGTIVGWRTCFALMSAAAGFLMIWIAARLPDFPGQAEADTVPIVAVGKLPGVRPILFITLTFVLAHNILYTYIVPLLQPADMSTSADMVLLVFGCCSLVSIWFVGILIDRTAWALAIVTCLIFIGAVMMFGIWPAARSVVCMAVALWGLAFGGAATIFQTAMARVAPRQTDIAQSMLVTAWNLAIAGGGIVGGLLLERGGISTFPPAVLTILIACALVVLSNRQQAFKTTP
ncbi:MFS transporter (plasmid) [Rhizobium sp. ACO-34A]|nr:MFS transporter [Rhizobium sp. ACO-34A]ATN37318.1 MFS transporter [Rhizobium sp. ACO-34A]